MPGRSPPWRMGRASVPCGAPKVSARTWPSCSTGEPHGGGGLADGGAQQRGVVGGRRGLVVLGFGVQADDGVEVDHAAGLVFGYLDEPDAELSPQGSSG